MSNKPQVNPQQRQANPNDPKDALAILFNAASIPTLDMQNNTLVRVAHVTLNAIVNPAPEAPKDPKAKTKAKNKTKAKAKRKAKKKK